MVFPQTKYRGAHANYYWYYLSEDVVITGSLLYEDMLAYEMKGVQIVISQVASMADIL